jgi:DNA mismatch repair protein MutS
LLDQALVAEPPLLSRDGGFIATGLTRTGRDPPAARRRPWRDRRHAGSICRTAGVAALKIKHNNVLGYFIEVTTTHEDKLRAHPDLFIHRQTTAGQVRFTTVALSQTWKRGS